MTAHRPSITSLIAQHVLDVHAGGNWTDVNLAGTLKDVTVEEALTRTPASPNTIAALVHHLTYWNRLMVQRINGVRVSVPPDNGFPVPASLTDDGWRLLKEDNIASAQELATAINGFDETGLFSPILEGYSSAYKNLQGTVEHIHYHLGQIVIVKNLLRAVPG